VCDHVRRMRLSLCILLLLALVTGSAAGATKPPKTTHTRAGMAAAQRLLLTEADVPRSWTAVAAGKLTPTLTCAGFSPSTAGIVETGSAASPAFRADATGPFAAEGVYVYATPAQAAAYWRRVVGPGIRSCMTQALVQGSTTDVKFTVRRTQSLALPPVGARRAGFRITATATTPGQVVTAYVDMLLLSTGKAIAAVSVSSFSEPVSPALERSLARSAARRLAAG
jgi:hypothetical protein